ncbi:MAG: hypothetical protein K0R09_2 [Clostridiales bacterium]|nr:hypothetical protein [Clostridiales bacterium]
MTNWVKIFYVESEFNRVCFLTIEQLRHYELSKQTEYLSFSAGSKEVSLRVVVTNKKTNVNELYFSEDVMNMLYIPPENVLQLKKIDDDYFELGPLIGIFVSSKKIAAMCEGKEDEVYEMLADTCKGLHGLCCFFSIGDIDWKNRLVKAMLWGNNRYSSHIMPLPMVIYDRCFGSYGRNKGMEFRKKLGSDYRVVNSVPKLGKWETIKALSKNPGLIEAIPETILYHSYTDVERALQKIKSVYVKPDMLYKGKGIYKVSRCNEKMYKVESRTETDNVKVHLPDLKGLDEMLSLYSARGGGYLIQNEINKASYRGYPFDFRLLYQKNWQGLWKPSGISVRMGAPGSIITSPRSGGAVEELSNVLKEVFNEDVDTKNGLYKKVIDIGREAAEAIDREFGDCVELGLDMTIDVEGKVWIIEINGKPLKVSIKWLNNPQMLARCYKRPVEYAVYLTGFESSDTELGG